MVEYLTQQQYHQLIALAEAPRDRLLFQVQYQAGCTVGELVDLRRTDIRTSFLTIRGRTCHVSPKLIHDLKEFITTHHSPYVFASRQSPTLTQKRVQQIVKTYLKKLGVHLEKQTPHVLRYSHIAHALAQRIPLRDIMAQTGLKPMRMAQLAQELGPQQGGYGGMLG